MTFDSAEITTLQFSHTASWHEESPAASGEGFLRLVQENHLRNFKLWHEEDLARCDHLSSDRIREAKRAIDSFNQERNNFIEEMDKALIAELQPVESGAPKNSEPPGQPPFPRPPVRPPALSTAFTQKGKFLAIIFLAIMQSFIHSFGFR